MTRLDVASPETRAVSRHLVASVFAPAALAVDQEVLGVVRSNEYSSGLAVGKILGALVLIALAATGGMLAVPQLSSYLSSNDVEDQGDRSLIVVSTSGGDRDQTLHVRNFIDTGGVFTMVFYLTASDITYGEGGNTFPVDFNISFAGVGTDSDIVCQDGLELTTRRFDELPVGTQGAILLDGVGGNASALNFRGGHDNPRDEEMAQQLYASFSGTLQMLNDSAIYSQRTTSDDVVVWAESCVLPEMTVWRYKGSSLHLAERRSLLLPQVDWTSNGLTTDFQKTLAVETYIDRGEGVQLIEAYPTPETRDSNWHHTARTYWVGEKGGSNNVGYSDQPVYIFADRSLADHRALFFLWAGVLLAVSAALVVDILRTSFELIWHRRQRLRTATR